MRPSSARLFASSFRSAAGSATTSRPRPSRLGETLSLEHFLQRAQVLALYRRILRDTRRIADESTREETRGMAREEFVRNRGVRDLGQIRYLLSTGRRQWEEMERFIDGL